MTATVPTLHSRNLIVKIMPAYRRTCSFFGFVGFTVMIGYSAGCSNGSSTVSDSACTTDDNCPGGYVCITSDGSGVCQISSRGGHTGTNDGGSNDIGGSSAKGGSSAGSGGSGKGGSGGGSGSGTSGSSGGTDGGPTGGSTDGGGSGSSGTGGSSGGTDGGTNGGTSGGGSGGINGGPCGPDGSSSGGGISCAGCPVWNSKVTYNTAGQLVEYNCKLYKNQGFAFDVNPETNNGQYYQWLLIGSCGENNCAMGEGPWIACGNYEHWTSGAYEIYNNVWGGDAAGPQCITAWDASHWTVQSTQPATSGVKSYPNSGFVKVGKTISALNTFTSSFDITVPSNGDWEASYDIWVPTEIMIWMYTLGNVGPIATSWDSSGKPIASATDVTLGGHTWNVYHQSGGTNVISFVRTTNTTSGTVDILALLNWAKDQGWIPDGTIGAAQFGFEISGTDNVATGFACNSFSMTID